MRSKQKQKSQSSYSIEFLSGLSDLVLIEISQRFGRGSYQLHAPGKSEVTLTTSLSWQELLELRSAKNVFVAIKIPGRRPSGFFGPDVQQALISLLGRLRNFWGESVKSFRFSAPGDDSELMLSVREKLQELVGLPYDQEQGDLLIRFLPGEQGEDWKLLIRLSARPLSVRSWKTVDYPGALDPTLASALFRLMPTRYRILDLCSGSGTFPIEAATYWPKAYCVGVDQEDRLRAVAEEHAGLAGVASRCRFLTADSRALPDLGKAFDCIVANLPWGERHGSRETNAALYQELLKGAEGQLQPNGFMLFVTQDSGAFEEVLNQSPHLRLVHRRQVEQGGFHPHIFLLQQRA
jgi:tRNA (guanine6-N2)-methyltransferase